MHEYPLVKPHSSAKGCFSYNIGKYKNVVDIIGIITLVSV
jgi:hypothetical protein